MEYLVSIFLGDWRYFWPETLYNLATIPSAWDSFLNTGIGQPALGMLWIDSYLHFTSTFTHLGLSWFWIGLLFWQLPALVLSVVGVFLLARQLFKLNSYYSALSGILYVANTYFLLLFLGGQAGIALAISIFPWTVLAFDRLLAQVNLKRSILFGLSLAVLLFFDPRVLYLALITLFLFCLFFVNITRLKTSWMYITIVPGIIVLLLHLFWLLPILVYKTTGVQQEIGSLASFKFFSFGGFDYALSWLHPNWPENVFGKIAFLNPVFLVFPLLAFSSLLFTNKTNKKHLVYLTLLAILGAFLAKGAKEPFSSINIFLFTHIPGMSLFRDTSKFYLLISFAYSLLIPYSLSSCSKFLTNVKRSLPFVQYCIPLLFVLFLAIVLSPVVKYSRVFLTVPKEYERFHTFMAKQNSYSRTLWLPEWQRFGYFSFTHPAIGRQELIKDTSIQGLKKFFARKDAEQILKSWSIRYVIVPYDSEQEIFLTDRSFSSEKRSQYVRFLDSIPYLRKNTSFGNLEVYELSNFNDHFSISNSSSQISWSSISPTKYLVKAKNGTIQGNLIFSESFDPHWTALVGRTMSIAKNQNGMNLFTVPKGTKEVSVQYQPQKLVNIGVLISLISLFGLIWLVVFVI